VAKPEWIADGDYPTADFKRVGVGHFEGVQIVGVNFDNRDFGGWVCADEFRLQFAAVEKCYRDFLGVFDDVVICEDVAIL
jgi:hypothetical protein